jgi:hypothetical protein
VAFERFAYFNQYRYDFGREFTSMKRFILILSALIMSTAAVQAAGAKRIPKFTVNETLLQGYTATPPAGWQWIGPQYHVATAKTEPAASQRLAALTVYIGTNATVPPPAKGLTFISLANGAILSKENLPADFQITAADCNFPNPSSPGQNNLCQQPPNDARVRLDSALPSRLVFEGTKWIYNTATHTTSLRVFVYVLDPAAPIGNADRWTLIYSIVPAQNSYFSFGGGGEVARDLYSFLRTTAVTTQVHQIVNK